MVHMLRKVTRSHSIARHFLDQTRLLTTQPAYAQPELLLRDYLHRSLYDPTEGYFTASTSTIPVGSIGKPLEFNKLLGQADYLSAVKQHYNHLQASWLTPSEIFTPYYGCAIANFILDKHSQMAEPGTPLRIFEIGGGTGTLARDILDHLRGSVPDVYREVVYRMVEISPVLARLQERTVADVGGHSDHFQVECRDAADLRGWEGSKGDDPCFLLLMEVLDNCPHDRVHRESPSQPWLQTAIREQQGSDSPPSTRGVEEVLQPLSDELIQQCLSVGPWEHNGRPFWHRLLDWAVDAGSHGTENTIFLPTGCMVLLDTLIKARPFHCILAADFDHLPETRIPGKNAPLVATTAGGRTIDHSTYLVDAGSADIFFPTDFYMLERMYGVLSQRDSAAEGITTSVLKNEAFMKRYASIAETTTVQGYNPLLQDYSNTSFFIGQRA